jgi:DUF971 family protein
MQPEKIESLAQGSVLRLTWDESDIEDLSAELLWSNCPSANARRQRFDLGERIAPADIRISGIELIGHYAVNIRFSDGHGRGIYPWLFLRQLRQSP